MKLDDGLRGVSRIGLDTAPIIYFVEANPRYDGRLQRVSELRVLVVDQMEP